MSAPPGASTRTSRGYPASTGEPPKQLKGFRSLRLGPGRTRRITLPITQRDLSYWDVKANGWRVQPGCVAVMLGSSSRDIAQRATLPVGGGRC